MNSDKLHPLITKIHSVSTSS